MLKSLKKVNIFSNSVQPYRICQRYVADCKALTQYTLLRIHPHIVQGFIIRIIQMFYKFCFFFLTENMNYLYVTVEFKTNKIKFILLLLKIVLMINNEKYVTYNIQ